MSRTARRGRPALLLSAAAAAAALVLTGCSAPTASGDGSAAPEERKTVRLVYTEGLLPLFAKANTAQFADVLAAEGVDVEWVDIQGAHAAAIAAVVGGSADITFGGSSTVALTSAASGQDIAIVGYQDPDPLDGKILAQKDSGITTVADLVGKTVAVNPGGFGEFTLVSALKKAGIPKDQVNFSYLSLTDGAAAFQAGQVDAYVSLPPTTEILEVQFDAVPVFDVDEDLTDSEKVEHNVYVTTREYAEQNRDVLDKVFAAYQAQAAWVNENPDAAFDLVNTVQKLDPEVATLARERQPSYTLVYPLGSAEIASLTRSAEFLLEQGVVTEKIDVTSVVQPKP